MRSARATTILPGAVALLAALAVAGCGSGHLDQPPPPQLPAPLTFQLQNGGTTSVYLFESCVLDLTITSLAEPPHAIGLPGGGCGICDCTAPTCPPVACGACY